MEPDKIMYRTEEKIAATGVYNGLLQLFLIILCCIYLFLSAASTNPLNNGWGLLGLDFSSGCA